AMDNGIESVQVYDRVLSPAQAEVGLYVTPRRLTERTELRGRLMGPSFPYGNTVEVAYSLRPLPAPPGLKALAARVILPQPSLWDPERPFLYRGPVELYEGGQMLQRVEVRHGLRQAVLGPRGLVWNGRPLTLRGREVQGPIGEAVARTWHDQGVN